MAKKSSEQETPRTATIALRTSPEIKQAAAKAARADRRTLSQWVEIAIQNELKGRKS
jgi:predicted HicB family RNase H-like nuclease